MRLGTGAPGQQLSRLPALTHRTSYPPRVGSLREAGAGPAPGTRASRFQGRWTGLVQLLTFSPGSQRSTWPCRAASQGFTGPCLLSHQPGLWQILLPTVELLKFRSPQWCRGCRKTAQDLSSPIHPSNSPRQSSRHQDTMQIMRHGLLGNKTGHKATLAVTENPAQGRENSQPASWLQVPQGLRDTLRRDDMPGQLSCHHLQGVTPLTLSVLLEQIPSLFCHLCIHFSTEWSTAPYPSIPALSSQIPRCHKASHWPETQALPSL